jgi:hypothetical protein
MKRKKDFRQKSSQNKSTKMEEIFDFNISYLKNDSLGGSKYWSLIVDEFTSMVWRLF